MCPKLFGVAALLLSVLMVVNVQGRPQQDDDGGITATATLTEPNTWDKIKKGVEKGWQVVYDESHCALHKAKELVKTHDHEAGSDPCVNKPYQRSTSTTQKSIVLTAEEIVPITSASPKPL